MKRTALQVYAKHTEDGPATYYFWKAGLGPSGEPSLLLDRPSFCLISRTILPHRVGQVTSQPPTLFKGREGRRVNPPPGEKSPARLILIFPEGGPLELVIGGRPLTAHPHEYTLLYSTEPYRVETVPQSFVTHRMIAHFSQPYMDEVWRQVGSGASTPLFRTGIFSRTPLLRNLIRLAFEQSTRPSAGWLNTETHIHQLAHWLCFSHPHDQVSGIGGLVLPPVHDPEVRAAIAFLVKHLAQPMALERVAQEVRLHKNTLNNRMQKSLGLSVGEFLQRYRMDRAQILLRETQDPVTQVALAVGLDPAHFSKVFRRLIGMTPAAYRKTQQR